MQRPCLTRPGLSHNHAAMFRWVLLSLCVLSVSEARAADPKIAVVDIEAVMNATDHWKKVVAVLQKERTEKQSKLEAKQKELKEKKDKLDAQKAVSDPKVIAAQEELLYKDAQVLTQGFMKSQKELTDREKKATDGMLARIEAIVRELALAGDYDFVFEAGSTLGPNVLYTPKKHVITDKVLEQYNKRFKDKPLDI
jgi:Skp family chaperone for outer membrane proteins